MPGQQLTAPQHPVRLQPMRNDHLDDVLAIERRLQATGWTRGIFERELSFPESRCYLVVTEPSGRVIGFGGMQLQVDEAHITTMAVDADHRRHGHATRLLIALLRDARARGARSATLEVRMHNTAAQRLYTRFGFRPVGVRPRYYGNTVDALIMWAHDIDGREYGEVLDALADGLERRSPSALEEDHGER